MTNLSESERLFKFILWCQQRKHVPDLHSFTIRIKNGTAYVEAQEQGIFVEHRIGDNIFQWAGTAIAATIRLEMLGADFDSIEM